MPQGLSLFHNTQHGERSLSFPGVFPERCGDVGVTFEAEHGNDGIAEGGQVLRGVAFANLAGVLIERNVPHIVRAVFDAPVAPPPSEQLGRIGLVTRHTGNRVVDFHRLDSAAPDRANQATHLRQVRPVAGGGEPRAGLQAATFMPAGSLTDRFRDIKMRFSLLLGRRGKKPP